LLKEGCVAKFSLIPREKQFFADFETMALEIVRAAAMLEDMLAPEHPIWDKAEEIKEVEHRCDFLTHEVIQRLNRTFITPLDREDIHALARSLDDVMDAIDASAAAIRLYQIATVRSGARELAHLIAQSAAEIAKAMPALDRGKGVHVHAVEINRLENEGDRMHQSALQQLFAEERDPIAIIKWKEILDILEAATDRCEDVANVLENIVVKHG
jgi:predicted phosphate transport protein (TIGR00153 family)